MNTVISLAPGNLGAALTLDAVRTHDILQIGSELMRPHYRRKADQAVEWLRAAIDNEHFFIHKPEGAFFLWLWFHEMPITCQELYERLKARGVVVVPGQYFFPGLDGDWRHKHECIRMSYAAEDEVMRRGVESLPKKWSGHTRADAKEQSYIMSNRRPNILMLSPTSSAGTRSAPTDSTRSAAPPHR